jgi:hypothetical protein
MKLSIHMNILISLTTYITFSYLLLTNTLWQVYTLVEKSNVNLEENTKTTCFLCVCIYGVLVGFISLFCPDLVNITSSGRF